MNVFRSPRGEREIRAAARSFYAQSPVKAESRLVDTDGFGSTHVLVCGPEDAPPLVLVHGTSSNSATWTGYFPEWSKLFHIFAVDMPGQPGLSDGNRPSLADGSYVRWLLAVAEALKLEKFHLCGRSMGGLVSLEFAMAHSSRLKSLALLSPGGLAPARGSFFLRILPWVFLGRLGARRINRIVHGRAPVDPRIDAFSIIVFKHFIPVTDKIPVFSDDAVRTIGCPVLYIGGSEDSMLRTRESAARLGALLPGSERHVLEGVGHVVTGEGERLADFFRRNS